MDQKPKTVLIGMPSGSGMVPSAMLQSLLQLVKPVPCGFMTVERQRIDKARNGIAMEALKGNFDYLLFVDDDNPIPPDTLQRFLEDDRDIVVAPILGRNPSPDGEHRLCAFYSREIRLADGRPLRLYDPIRQFREMGPLHRVDAAGTGCMLIKRRVLEALHAAHGENIFEFGDIRFDPVEVDGATYRRRTMSEDCEFSERAVDAGFEIWLDDRVRPFHITGVGSVQWGGTKNR